MSTIYMTSDQHFGHSNIIEYENRPFSSADEMNSYMLKNKMLRHIFADTGDFR